MGLMIVFAVAGFFLAGCVGGQIREDRRIPLVEDTSQSGNQTDVDFDINYRYRFRQADPQQPGQLDLEFNLKRKRGFYSFTAFVNYLDAEGQVIGKNSIYSLGNRSGVVHVSEGPFETPPGTVAIAFTSVSRDFKSKQ
jgi:hypothetical protein